MREHVTQEHAWGVQVQRTLTDILPPPPPTQPLKTPKSARNHTARYQRASKNNKFKMYLLLEMVILHRHVSFQGCTSVLFLYHKSMVQWKMQDI